MAPRISVIIPAYNHERFVGAAVDSVLEQSLGDLELIVIDDGSTDRTGEIVQGYTDKRVRYYHQENMDAYNTLNRGIELARGHYISILNSDDVYSLNRLERLFEISQERGMKCLFTDVVPISDSGIEFVDTNFGWNLWHQKNRDFFFECNDLYMAFLKGNFMVTTSNLFLTAEAARKVGKFKPLRYLHDYDYIFRLLLAFPKQVDYIHDEKLLYYRIHSGNTLGEAAIIGREQDQQVIRAYMQLLLPETYRKYVDVGAERLINLGEELHEVKMQLESEQSTFGVKAAAKLLLKRVGIGLKSGLLREKVAGKKR
jgi:glycosyltransferase involved in cell wall biosynthesis